MAISFRGIRCGLGTEDQFRTETEHDGGGFAIGREDLAGLVDRHLGFTISFHLPGAPELSAEDRRYVDHVKELFITGLTEYPPARKGPVKWLKDPVMRIKLADEPVAGPEGTTVVVQKEGEYLVLVTFRFALEDHPRIKMVATGLREALVHGWGMDQFPRKAARPAMMGL